jgi:hypothetical protein
VKEEPVGHLSFRRKIEDPSRSGSIGQYAAEKQQNFPLGNILLIWDIFRGNLTER